jgi:hypothetical protein
MFFLLVESGIMPPSPQELTACPSPLDSKDAKGRIFIGCYRPLAGCTVAVFWANQFVTLIKINVVGGNFVGSPDHVPITAQTMEIVGNVGEAIGREVALRPRSDRSIFRALISMYGKAALPRLVSFGRRETEIPAEQAVLRQTPFPRKFSRKKIAFTQLRIVY